MKPITVEVQVRFSVIDMHLVSNFLNLGRDLTHADMRKFVQDSVDLRLESILNSMDIRESYEDIQEKHIKNQFRER